MTAKAAVLVLFSLLPSLAFAQLQATIGPRGEITQLRNGDVVYFTDVAVSLVKPGWSGDLLNQRTTDPAAVTVETVNGATVYTVALSNDTAKATLRETVTVTPEAVSVQYELTPEQDIDVETVLLQGLMPIPVHGGVTRFVAANGGVAQGTCPAELNPATYVIFGGRAAELIGFMGPAGTAVRVTPTGVTTQFQDNRKWNTPSFALQHSAPGGRLAAGKTIRFGLKYAADTAQKLESEVRALMVTDISSLQMSDNRPLGVRAVALAPQKAEVYSPIEVTADVAATYDNPFDPDQIAVDAEVTPPNGVTVSVPGFYYAPMRLETKLGTEQVRLDGKPGFRVRYTPLLPGQYRLLLKVRDRSGTVSSTPVRFTASASQQPGFVRVAKGSPRYFALDDGKPYVAVGENVCWAGGPAPLSRYASWFEGLGGAGGNWARLWLAYNEKGLEWMPPPTPKGGTGTYLGLGRYAQDNAWRLDEVVRLARDNNLRLMFCFGTYGEFTDGGYFNEGSWVSNPYNIKNGGPCEKPADFWTNPQARKLYQQRLRYLIARWGYSPTVFAWEFWNEVPPNPAQEVWVAEMAAFLKQHDPNHHLVSTTYGSPAVWKCPDVDFTMTHMYGQAGNTADFTPQIERAVAASLPFNKPYLLAEFGIDWQAADTKWDPKYTGLNMHNGAWATLLSGGAGTAMLWWWDSYVPNGKLYHVLTPIRKFADTIDWPNTQFQPLSGLEVKLPADAPEVFTDMMIPGNVEWGKTPSAEYTVGQDGSILGAPVAMTIGSPKRHTPSELHTSLTWHLDMPKAGKVVARLGNVCSSSHLQIMLDGQMLVDRELPAGEEGKGPWKKARYMEQYKIWVSDYDEDIVIEVPAGKHDLTFANTSGDWLQIRSLTLPEYRSSRYPDLNLLGLSSERLLLLWVHNRQSTWRTEFDGKQPLALQGARVTLPAPAAGPWEVRWWDTFTGQIISTEQATAADGKLSLTVPTFSRDLAAQIVQKR